MAEPDTFWLSATNVALGVVVALCLLASCFLVVRELIARGRKHRAEDAELDRDMQKFFGHSGRRP